MESWNNERESDKLGNILDKGEKTSKDNGLLRGGRKESQEKQSGEFKTVGRKGWAQKSGEQRRLKSNFREAGTVTNQVRESTTNIEVPFKDPQISRRHGRNKVDEDDGKETVEKKDDKEEGNVDEESETSFLVTQRTQRGRKAWLNERRRRQ